MEVDGVAIGALRRDRWPRFAAILSEARCDEVRVQVRSLEQSYASRTALFEPLVEALAAHGEISKLRHERYAAPPPVLGQPHFEIERAAVPWLGIGATGVHLNGFVREGSGLSMWIAHRSREKPTYPGQLDNMVAGGQPAGLGLFQNLIKECAEEASIPEALARRAKAVGLISYCCEQPAGLKPDVMHCFDLELPREFRPENSDGEVERFELVPVEEVARIVADGPHFKFNCALVVIDFLVRHGFIPPDHQDYLAIVRGLRAPPWPRGSAQRLARS